MPGRMSLILQFLVPLIPTWSSPANLGSTVIVTPISACVSEVTWGIFFRKLAVLKTTKSDGSRDVDHMFVPISTLERQKDRETEGLKLSEMVARPRLGIRSQRKLGAEWNECRYFDTLTPICLVRCVVRTSPCFHRLLFVHTHSSYFEPEHASTEILPTNPVWIYFRPFLSILSWASEPSISDIMLRQIVPYNFSKRAKKVLLIFQILHGVQNICQIDKYCSPASLNPAIALHNLWFWNMLVFKHDIQIFSPEAYGIQLLEILLPSPNSFFRIRYLNNVRLRQRITRLVTRKQRRHWNCAESHWTKHVCVRAQY